MEKSGKWLVVAIFAIALSLGAFSWWFRWSATHRAAEFWGPEAANAIRDGEYVLACKLGKLDMTTLVETPSVEFNASKAPGLVHLRNALLLDRSFVWEGPLPPRHRNQDPVEFDAHWKIHFLPSKHNQKTVIIGFNEKCTEMRFSVGLPPDHGSSSPLRCNEKFAAGLRALFAEWFPPASN